MRKENKQLKKKIKELGDEIDSLTETNDDLNNIIDGFFDNEPIKNDSIIYDIFRVYAVKSSNYSDISEPLIVYHCILNKQKQ